MDEMARRRWRSDVVGSPADGATRAALLDPVATEAAGGDLDALEDLIWAVDELKIVRRSIRRLVVDDADAEEVEQDVLVALAESITTYRGEARFTTWLHEVARHKAIANLRRRRGADLLPEGMGDAARISSMIATRTALDDAIRGLPERYRDAVVLRDIEQRPYLEVADRLGVNLNTAKTTSRQGPRLVAARLRDAS